MGGPMPIVKSQRNFHNGTNRIGTGGEPRRGKAMGRGNAAFIGMALFGFIERTVRVYLSGVRQTARADDQVRRNHSIRS